MTDNLKNESSGFALLCDNDGSVLKIIRDGLNITGEEIVGKQWTSLVDEESLLKSSGFVESIKNEGATFEWELNLRTSKGIEAFSFAGIDRDENYVIVIAKTNREATHLVEQFTQIGNEQINIIRKVTKENAKLRTRLSGESSMYDEISRLNNELVNLQRTMVKKNVELQKLNQLKNRFLGMAAHDLRNPLGNILNLAEFLEAEKEKFSEEELEFLSYIKSLSSYMLNLVNELLDFSAIESGSVALDVQSVDYLDLVKNNIFLNKMIASKKEIEISLKSDLERCTLQIDQSKVAQVINNLLSNAVKYSHPKTRVIVEVKQEKNAILTSVIDRGQGIAADELEHLFKPFQKTSTKSTAGESSTGLGLFIAKRLIEVHKGQIWVESEQGSGTAFHFTLPVVK